MPYDSPLPGVYIPRSVEGSMKLKELTDLCIKLVTRVTSLETELKNNKEVHGKALTNLVKKFKRLEDKLKSTNERKKEKMVISDEVEELVSKDTSKQGRMEVTEYADVEEENAGVKVQSQETFEAELSVLSAAKILAETSKERVKTYNRRRRSTDSSQVSTAEDIQDTDEELAKKVQEKEQTKGLEQQEQERANLEAALNLQKQFDQERKAVDKNMANYKMKYFKGMSYDQIRPIFEEEYKKVQTLFKKDSEVSKSEKKRDAKEALLQESFRKLRTSQASEAYQGFEDMLKAFDREDLDTLWSLVKEKFRSVEPTEDMERALWVELKRLYKPDKEDTLWKLQRYMHDPLTWRLYGSCAVHHVFSTRGHCIYMLPEKDYPLTTAVMMLMLSRRLQVEEDSEMARDLVKKIFIEANRSRR
ncbi:hypothetical protein Tco_1161708 [Tanacetum coccineum]